MGSMYAAVFFLGVQLASSVQPVVSVERTVFYRERAAGLYSALPYAVGQVHHSKILAPSIPNKCPIWKLILSSDKCSISEFYSKTVQNLPL